MNQFYEVIAVSSEKGRLEEFGRLNNVRTFNVEMTRAITPLKDIKAVLILYRFLKSEKPTIVHTHTPKAGIIGMMAAKMANIPIRIHTVAGLPLLETSGMKRILLNFVEKFTYSLANRVYPNSEGLKKIILENKFTDEKKIKVLGKGSSNGIDTTYFDPGLISKEEKTTIRKTMGIPVEDFVYIFIGRLVSEKGINELVSAFTTLQKEKTNLSLLLVGPYEYELDPLETSTLAQIKDNDKIYTTGYKLDVRPFLAISDVLVFPSYREGFPNVVMQAGAMGLPSIVSDINGCNEIIINEYNGLIIPAKNTNRLLEAMRKLLKEPGMKKLMAANARDQISLNYSRTEFWEILKKEYEDLSRGQR